MNYDIWRELFEIHCVGYGVADHFEPPVDAPSPPIAFDGKSTAKTAIWKPNDSVFKSWLYGILSPFLHHLIFKKQIHTYKIWETIEMSSLPIKPTR